MVWLVSTNSDRFRKEVLGKLNIIDQLPITELFEYFSRLIEKPSKEHMKMIESFLECAKRDFHASKVLYNEKDIPNSIYHLQQSVEKLTKAYAIYFLRLTYEEVRSVGHTTPIIFLNMIRTLFENSIKLVKAFDLNFNEALIKDITKIVKELKHIEKMEEIAKISKDKIASSLKLFHPIQKNMTRIRQKIIEVCDTLISHKYSAA